MITNRLLKGWVLAWALTGWLAILGGQAGAQVVFDQRAYKALAQPGANETVAPGTEITLANWQQYKRFMPIALQALFSGKYPFRVGTGPDYKMMVGPTISIPLPKAVQDDSEKYSGQARIVKSDAGAALITGYMAGVPFPRPEEPDIAGKVFYNAWFSFKPLAMYFCGNSKVVDRYGNSSPTDSCSTQYRLEHLSDPPNPMTKPDNAGSFYRVRIQVVAPEQSKYTTELTSFSDDPNKTQELYVFLPSLRRSLRLSAAARCAPIQGSDYVQDDNLVNMGFLPANFSIKYLGQARILSLVHAQAPARDHLEEAMTTSLPFPGGFKPAIGKYELRDVNIIDATPLPSQRSYCYGHKVAYLDKQTFLPMWVETYDVQGKFYKVFENADFPVRLPDGEEVLIGNSGAGNAIDVQNSHATTFVNGEVSVDGAVPQEVRDYAVYGTPSGLSQIMR